MNTEHEKRVARLLAAPPESLYSTGGALYADWLAALDATPEPAWLAGDPIFGGVDLRPGRVILIGGAPGGGKTTLAVQLVFDAVERHADLKAVIANVEMQPGDLIDKTYARWSGVPLTRIVERRTTPQDAPRLAAARERIGAALERIAIVSEPQHLTATLVAARETGARLVLLDYAQMMQPHGEPQGDEPRAVMSALLADCRDNATAMGLCVVLVAALGRAGGSYRTPGLSSFRESSAFEYTADDAVLLSRHPDAPDDPEDDEGDAPPPEASDLLVLFDHVKARRGRTYRRRLVFDRARQSFRRATANDGGPVAAPPPSPTSIALPGESQAAPTPAPTTDGGPDPDSDPF